MIHKQWLSHIFIVWILFSPLNKSQMGTHQSKYTCIGSNRGTYIHHYKGSIDRLGLVWVIAFGELWQGSCQVLGKLAKPRGFIPWQPRIYLMPDIQAFVSFRIFLHLGLMGTELTKQTYCCVITVRTSRASLKFSYCHCPHTILKMKKRWYWLIGKY